MRRVFFKPQMRDAIVAGKKVSTTRTHPLHLEDYQAVYGSYYDAKPFAIIRFTDRIPTTWENVIRMFYKEEGFETPEEMREFIKKEKLLGAFLRTSEVSVYWHRFEVIKKLSKGLAEDEEK